MARAAVTALLAFGLAGCATRNATPTLATADASPPRVTECAMVGQGSPTSYICDGKKYTAFQLTQMREEWAANHKAATAESAMTAK